MVSLGVGGWILRRGQGWVVGLTALPFNRSSAQCSGVSIAMECLGMSSPDGWFCRSRLGSGSGLFLFGFLGMFVNDVGQFADEAREGEIRVMCPLPSCHLSPRRQSTLDQF